ncbi:phosphatase PAP2 family protein [Pseudarthrobacter sp. R1]|uniref:phosphatase PAP2 family protein n=1 Tax=Pseudarthrobacter sp. R1 TaxID=2944934 RepID=UPI00210B3006|nr:phosphatase PAP2 family protein [Pseudarthrobacter sp. R1]MCQ6271873.1 phosphatase PAP2 family protein [Pseudarthrobacter sp. R1]
MEDERRHRTDESVQGELNQDRFVGGRDLTRWHYRAARSLVDAVQWISERLGPHGALILTLAAGAVIAAALTSVFAEVYESVTEADGVAGLDQPVLEAGKGVRSPAMDVIVTAYTNIGGGIGMPVLALIAIAVLGFRRRSWTPVILIATSGAGAVLMITSGKQLIGRLRPPFSDAVPPYQYSAAFPSGHALGSLVVAGIVAYLVVLRLKTSRRRLLAVAVATVFAATMGLSRVYLGHHWLTDVLAAWALGAAWLAMVITAHRLYLTVSASRQLRPDPPPG